MKENDVELMRLAQQNKLFDNSTLSAEAFDKYSEQVLDFGRDVVQYVERGRCCGKFETCTQGCVPLVEYLRAKENSNKGKGQG